MKPRSDTLFHFTKNIDTLKSILKNGFWPRYSLEDFRWYNPQMDFISYPMVCFCDIPLTRLREHVNFYGDYGLGMTKQWAKKNGLNPVVYLSQSTPLLNALVRLFGKNPTSFGGYYLESAEDVNSILSYIKPIEGNITINGRIIYKEFYQENEWRYVPKAPTICQWISKEVYSNNVSLFPFNEGAKFYGALHIVPTDVKYIFVKFDYEIPNMINYIQQEFGHYPENDFKILMSRIVSLESINVDL